MFKGASEPRMWCSTVGIQKAFMLTVYITGTLYEQFKQYTIYTLLQPFDATSVHRKIIPATRDCIRMCLLLLLFRRFLLHVIIVDDLPYKYNRKISK